MNASLLTQLSKIKSEYRELATLLIELKSKYRELEADNNSLIKENIEITKEIMYHCGIAKALQAHLDSIDDMGAAVDEATDIRTIN